MQAGIREYLMSSHNGRLGNILLALVPFLVLGSAHEESNSALHAYTQKSITSKVVPALTVNLARNYELCIPKNDM